MQGCPGGVEIPVVPTAASKTVISTATTTVKASAGTIYMIFWAAGGAGSSIAVYDDGAGGTTNQFVGQLTTTNDRIDFGAVGCAVTNGITVVTTGGTPPFVTVVWR